MATDTLPTNDSKSLTASSPSDLPVWDGVKRVLEPAASLKLTVVLFALSIFLILAGTFAQVDKDIWEVIGLYFRCWMAWVPLQVFFPPSFFPENPVQVSGGFFFPGGKLLGLLLAVNLVSAHLVRFKAVAKGGRLFAGFLAIAAGCAVTYAIIAAGGNSKGIQGDPLIPYHTQWIGYQGLLGLAALSAGFGLVGLCQQPLAKAGEKWRRQLFLRGVVAAIGFVLAALLTWILMRGESGRPTDASLRILWQLTQGTVASIALLGGCWAVFGQRAGIVLLHGGIGLMMFYELHVALTAVETQMNLVEGERTNFVHDIRTVELAFVDVTDPKEDRVVAIPKSFVTGRDPIETAELPFRVIVKKFEQNARLRPIKPEDTNLATEGIGQKWFPEARQQSAGTDNDSKIDMPAAYVTLESKTDGKSLGTHLVSLELSLSDKSDVVQVGDRSYLIELRPKRYYKPYVFQLNDVRKEDYLGTSTPRNYASTVHVVDTTRNVDEDKTIWMNNPLRFADETFYQSGYHQEEGTGVEHTTLSVVANSGWMMPYVGCMLVGVGMLVHFLSILFRFLTRGDTVELSTDEAQRASQLAAKLGMTPKQPVSVAPQPVLATSKSSRASLAFTAAVMACAIGFVIYGAIPPKPKELSFDLYRFGQIPVVSEGRTKPLDSAARSSLLTITGYTQVVQGEGREKTYTPAIQWLLEVISDAKISDERHIFRIENLEVQETVGVKKREGMRYARNEIQSRAEEFKKQFERASKQSHDDPKQLSVAQKKLLELGEKFSTFQNLKAAFGLQNTIGGNTETEVFESFRRVMDQTQGLEERGQPVFAVGPTSDGESWHTLARAWMLNLVNRIQKKGEPNPTVLAWEQILKAFSDDKPADFNKAVDTLLAQVKEHPSADVTPWVIQLESYINYTQPFSYAIVMYLLAFILGAMGWLVWPQGFNRAAFGLLSVAFVVHTGGLLARLIISGRPPVTNLYSSAVFIGWGCVLLGMLFELVYRIGIGNLVAGVAGYATLLIAEVLASDGDTFTVLQAVLDTQFWLATHVTCITLGYATTYLAGLFGVAYIVRGVLTPSLTAQDGRDITRMIYGTLCFSIFFSFIGTVLGGLWADDSWGRFWGWDPKENAALIIVLWNALALHARWGGMVRERGLAALAVGGNIVVSWSWWGVNALGAGLHSYGFKKGTLMVLGLFILANLAIIGVGMLPKQYWWSIRRREAAAPGV